MTAKEMQQEAAIYLSRYRSAQGEVRDIERRIEHVRDEMMGVKGISYEGGNMPKARDVERDLSDYAAKIDDLLRGWQKARLRAIETMRDISEIIEGVEHGQARRVLMLHFIDGHTYEKAARLIPCANDTVYRYRRIGLQRAAEIINEKSVGNRSV